MMAPRVSEEHRRERRTQILNSALQCFSEQGFAATTVDDIVRTAGVSKGMAYTYFTSKEEMFLGIVNDRTEAFFEHLQDVFQTLPTAWQKLSYVLDARRAGPQTDETRKWVTVYLEFFLSASRDRDRQRYMHERYHRFLQLIQDVVDEGKRTGEFRQDVNSPAVAALYWALCDGIDLHLSQLADVMDADEIYRSATEVLRAAVMKGQAI